MAAEAAVTHPAPSGRLHLTIHFRLPQPTHAGEFWDIDNLIKPTMDAMSAIFGSRDWRGRPQAQDDRVDSLFATKQTISAGEPMGALIEVRLLHRPVTSVETAQREH